MFRIILLFVLLTNCNQIFSQITLPRIVRDSMILQRDTNIKIWGWATPKEKVKITFKNKKYQTTTSVDGKWSIVLEPTPAGGPYSIQISGKNTINLKEILFGDVWLCSGQSNMVHQMNIHDVTYAEDIANANYPAIRQFWVPTLTSLTGPADNLPVGEWKAAVGEDVRPFSAVAYFFAKKIFDEYKIPIGIINASVGGTPIEAWISEEGFKDFPLIQETINRNRDTSYLNSLNRRPQPMNRPAPQIMDKGLSGEIKWYEKEYIPQNWKNIAVPGYWEDQGIKDLNGVVWYRKEIDVPASMVGKSGKLFLGRIVDADVVYINGRQIGSTGYMYPQRRYPIPVDVLTPGKNVITVKITNNGGKGGFVPDKPYCLFTGKDTINLTGYWQYKVGEVFMPRTGGGFGGGGINAQNQPTALYNRMVAPYTDYEIKGVLWYQGESNSGRAADYLKLQEAQIIDWRQKFRQPKLPFYFVQLPNFMDANYIPSESQWAAFRESQLKSLSIPHTGMAVIIDLGEWNDIHPDNKKDVGERLALIAQNKLYGKDVVFSGPIFKSAEIENGKIVISFDHVGSGLTSKDGEELREFAIAGEDKKFVWASTKIQDGKIVVWSDQINSPKYVRYAWADNPDVNFYNKEGLPASPFRTDN
jgi:sialate O-acetylesterase